MQGRCVLRDVAQWATWMVGGQLGRMILEVFSKVNDSVSRNCGVIQTS